MTINKIQNNLHYIDPVEGKREVEKQHAKKNKVESDSVELSQKAKELCEKRKAEKYAEIKKNIYEKYYDNLDVIDKVADAILKELE